MTMGRFGAVMALEYMANSSGSFGSSFLFLPHGHGSSAQCRSVFEDAVWEPEEQCSIRRTEIAAAPSKRQTVRSSEHAVGFRECSARPRQTTRLRFGKRCGEMSKRYVRWHPKHQAT